MYGRYIMRFVEKMETYDSQSPTSFIFIFNGGRLETC